MARIRIRVSPTGTTTISVEGATGPSCKSLTRDLEDELGTTVADVKTAEYNQVSFDAEQEGTKQA